MTQTFAIKDIDVIQKKEDVVTRKIPQKLNFREIHDFLTFNPFAIRFDTNRTIVFANSFISVASRDWNSLPPSVFRLHDNLQSFKTLIHRYLQLQTNP